MERQNITLSLPKNLLKRAKVFAAKKEKSLSELIRELLEEKIKKESGLEKAKNRAIRMLKKGFDLGTGGELSFKREELHERG